MSQIYVNGPALIYVGVPIQLAGAIVIPPPTNTFSSSNFANNLPSQSSTPPLPIIPSYYAAPVIINRPDSAELIISTVLRQYAAFYLGTTKSGVFINKQPKSTPWYSDEGGSAIGAEFIYEGEEAFITADVNRFNEPVYDFIASRAGTSVFSLPPFNIQAPGGIELEGYIGTCMVAEGAFHPLWIVSPYAGKISMGVFGAMKPGYRFFACKIVGPERMGPLGTTPKSIRLTWHAMRLNSNGAFVLHDHNVDGLPNPN